MGMTPAQWQHDSQRFKRQVFQLSRGIMEIQNRIKASTNEAPVSCWPLPSTQTHYD
jgi:hypothetical protein